MGARRVFGGSPSNSIGGANSRPHERRHTPPRLGDTDLAFSISLGDPSRSISHGASALRAVRPSCRRQKHPPHA